MQRKTLKHLVRMALDEDIAQGDITTNLTVPTDATCQATLRAKQDGVLSGIEVFKAVFKAVKTKPEDWTALSDGAAFKKGDTIASFTGRTAPTLTGERTAMNFIQHLSGVATSTADYLRAVDGLDVRICDTRKTTPMLRALEKEAVLHGGGTNHRNSLSEAILIKDNHIEAAGGIAEALHAVSAQVHHLMKIEIEVTDLTEFNEAMDAAADVIMLDNMPCEDMARAAKIARGTRVLLEASGNVTLDSIREIAGTGVDFISVGALTHSAKAVDMSLLISNI